MPQWIVVSRSQHIGMHYIKHDGYHYAAKQSVASVMLAELPKLLPHYVLGFIQQEGRYRPVAMLSLDGQNNHYVHSDGRWLGSYVPASLRGYPFSLADIEGDQKHSVWIRLC
ncbi:hypothetical protein HORIV_20970 [Vreelandella olivaria]|uniref:Uncharacterized protein n=1 Tax=Vreelandella olivaria TaxID=390919 RepID=A0ABM7GGG3_9GAMM|nr:hypothetical protein HORIV_20970 [Halomonas olivaria]